MFHAFDNDTPDKPLSRATWMSVLANAPVDLLESALASHSLATPQWLRAPETGLMMVQGRAGATGERFNLGEVTVTRCALRLSPDASAAAQVGVSYVLGRSHRQALLAAAADALLQDPTQHDAIQASLLEPVRKHLALQRAVRHTRAQSTKVEFFTVAREAGAPNALEDTE
jgi:alpha-D-ribose 1-methylphosphonate 5-triphosphate synthase subunit PhnG